MQLTTHFSLEEMIASQTAARQGIDNTPSPEIVDELRITAELLEEVRALLGGPILVSSGYRCLALNRAVGSADTSAHILGRAADFTCAAFGTPINVCLEISDSRIVFDQLIYEFRSWTHIGRADKPRGQVLVIDEDGTRFAPTVKKETP